MNMPDMEMMRRSYDTLPLAVVEEQARKFQAVETDAHRNLINVLSYLEHTRRYKEDPAFKKSTFDQYLRAKWNLSYNQFLESKTAYLRHPDLTTQFGVGVIVEAIRKCGADRIQDIERAVKESANPIDQEGFANLVRVFSRGSDDKKRTDWKNRFLALDAEANLLREEIAKRDAEIASLREQLAGMRITTKIPAPVEKSPPRRGRSVRLANSPSRFAGRRPQFSA